MLRQARDPPGRQRGRSFQTEIQSVRESQRESRSRDTKTIIYRDFSLPPRQVPSPDRRVTRRVRATLYPRCGFRVAGYEGTLARNHRSRERITRRPSSKLSRCARERPARVYIGRISPRLYDFVERRWAEEEAREPEQDGGGARKRSFVPGSVGTPRRSPNDGATIELCISHETLRGTEPFVNRGTWERYAHVQQAFFSDRRFRLREYPFETLGFVHSILTGGPFNGLQCLYKQKLRLERSNTLWKTK